MKSMLLLSKFRRDALCLFVSFGTVQAVDFAWDPGNNGNGGAGTWNTSSLFWDNNAQVGVGANTNVVWVNAGTSMAFFGSANGTSGIVSHGAVITVGGITFNDAPGYTISSASALTFGATGFITTNVDATINSILAGNVTIRKNGFATLTLGGTNTFSGQLSIEEGVVKTDNINNASVNGRLGSSALSVSLGAAGGNTGTLQYTGATVTSNKKFTMASDGIGDILVEISNTELTLSGVIDGAGQLSKSGDGLLTLSGINTYSGGTTIYAGTLKLGNTQALGTTGAITMLGGTLLYAPGFTTDYSSRFSTADSGQNFKIDTNNQSVTFAGALQGTFNELNKLGAGTLTLTGANNHGYATTVGAGTLTVSGAGTLGNASCLLLVGGSGTLNIGTTTQTVNSATFRSGSIVSGSGTITAASSFEVESGAIGVKLAGVGAFLTKSGAGSCTLTGINTYGGGTNVLDGTLTVSGSGTLGLATSTLTVDGFLSILSLGSTNQSVATANLSGSGTISGTGTLSANTAFEVKQGLISAKLAGTGYLRKTNTNFGVDDTVTISTGVSSSYIGYAGSTFVDEGILAVKNKFDLPGQTTPGKINIADGATLALSAGGTNEFTTTEISNILTNATIAANASLGIDTTNAPGANFTYGIALSGARSLTKIGTGTLTFSVANNFTGTTVVKSGTVTVSGPGTLGGATAGITVDGAGSILNIGATTQTLGTVTLKNNGTINGSGVLNASVFDLQFGSVTAKLGGAGGVLTKTTADTVTLSGANTFGGGVNVNDGIMALVGSTALGSSGTISFGGGTLKFSATNTTDYSARFSNAPNQAIKLDTNNQTITLGSDLTSVGGTLLKTGAGTLVLSGTNSYAGGTTVNEGTLRVTKALAGTLTMAAGTTLAINAGGVGEISSADIATLLASGTFPANSTFSIDTANGNFLASGQFSQSLKLVKLGANTLTLSGPNTYTGGTVIGAASATDAGTILLSGAGTLGTAAPLTIFGGTLDLGGTVQTITTLTMGGGAAASTAAIALGAGELKLGGDVTYVSTNNPNGATISATGAGALSLLGNRNFIVGDSTVATADLTISAIIQNGLPSVARNVIKTGAGTLVLSGNNTYSGVTTVSAGTLQATKTAALPEYVTAAKVVVSAGATLVVNAGGPDEFSAANVATLINNASFASNTAVLGIDTTNATGGTVTFSGNLTKALALRKLGTGTLVMPAGSHTYSGLTTVSAGTFQVDGALTSAGGAITVASGGTLNIANGIAVARAITVNGGTMNLTGIHGLATTLTLSSTTSGVVNVLGTAAAATNILLPSPAATPIFNVPSGQELAVSGTLTQTIAGGSLAIAGTVATPYRINGANLVNNIDNLFLRGGTTTITRTGLVNMPTTNVTLSTANSTLSLGAAGSAVLGNLTLAAANSLTFTMATNLNLGNISATENASILGTTTVSLRNGSNVTVADTKTLISTSIIADSTTAVTALNKLGPGVLQLGGANNFSGATTVSAGTLRAAVNNALGAGGSVPINTSGPTTVNGSSAAAILELTSPAVVNEAITLNGSTNGASLLVTSGTATLGNGIAEINFTNGGTGSSGTAGTVTFVGGGGVNASASTVTVSGGAMTSVRVTAAGSGYTSAPTMTYSSGTGRVATAVLSSLTLTGTNNNLGGDGGLTINAKIGQSAPGAGFAKIGAGTLTLNGINTYTGNTTVSAGTLNLADNAGLSFVVTNASSTRITGAGTATLSGDFTIDTTAVNVSAGTWSLVSVATLAETFTPMTFTVVGFSEVGDVWSKTVGPDTWVFREDTGELKLNGGAVSSPYSLWATAKGLTGVEGSGSSTDPSPAADPDKDGNNNLAEFAYNGDPRSSSDRGKIYTLLSDSPLDGDSLKELIMTVAVRNSAVFTSGAPCTSTPIDGINYAIEGSVSLNGFPGTVNVVPTAIITGLPLDTWPDYEYRSFSLGTSNNLPNQGYLRATATKP